MSEAEKMAMLHRAMMEIDATCARVAPGRRPYLGNALTRVVDALGANELPARPAQSLDAARLNS